MSRGDFPSGVVNTSGKYVGARGSSSPPKTTRVTWLLTIVAARSGQRASIWAKSWNIVTSVTFIPLTVAAN